MKTIHVLFAAAFASSPLVAHAQSTEPAPAETEAAAEAAAVQETDIGSTGSGTGDIGSTGSGTGTIGSTGSGTGTIGSTGSGTGTLAAEPAVSLHLRSNSLRTPGTMQLTVSLAAEPDLSPAASASIVVPLTSSSAECSVPASVTVDWNSASGGLATASVTCARAPGQTVTLSSGTARASFTTK